MERFRIRESSKIYLLALFILIYTSKDTMFFGTNSSIFAQKLGYIVNALVCLSLLFYVILRNKKISRGSIQLLFALTILVIFTMILNVEISGKYGFEIMLFLTALLFVNVVDIEQFKECFIKIILFLSVFSLITWVLYLILFPIVQLFPKVTNESSLEYYFLFFSVIPSKDLDFRNYGIFREPGFYIIMLSIAMIFEISRHGNMRVKHIVVFSITIITTLSTAGFVILGFLLLGLLLFENKKANRIKLVLFTSLVIGSMIMLNTGLLQRVLGKIFSENASSTDRFESIKVNIQFIIDKPSSLFFGNGFSYVEDNYIRTALSIGSSSTNNTNTILKILSVHGIIYTVLIVFFQCKFWSKLSHNLTWSTIFIVAFYLCLLNEEIIMNFLLYLVCFYGLAEKKEEKNADSRN